METLLIFDLEGVCCQKDRRSRTTIDVSGRSVHIRPKIRQILTELSHQYRLAVWTSTPKKIAHQIVNHVFQDLPLVFTWYRTETEFDPDFGFDPNIDRYATVKTLDRVFYSLKVNPDRRWTGKNTLLIDDSPVKTRFNEEKNVLIFDLTQDLILLPALIRKKVKKLSLATSVYT